MNFTYYAASSGAESYPVSAVGRDVFGDEALEKCRRFWLNTRYISRNDLPTSRVLVSLDDAGIPGYEILEGVAWDALEASVDVLRAVSCADAVCRESLASRSNRSQRAISAMIDATSQSCMKVFDINLRQNYYSAAWTAASLERATVLKLNEDELPVIQSLFPCRQNRVPVKVADTVGAGDAFTAGFITSLLDGTPCGAA